MEDNVTEQAGQQQEPTEDKQQTDPRITAARKEAIGYRERAKSAEAKTAEVEAQLAKAQEELLGLKRVKAIEDSCAKYEGLTAQDFNEFCHETEPDAMRSWADRIAERFAHGLTRTRPDTLGDKGAFSDNSRGRYGGGRSNMRSAVNAAIKKSW